MSEESLPFELTHSSGADPDDYYENGFLGAMDGWFYARKRDPSSKKFVKFFKFDVSGL